jgi:hypothetical protein
MSSAGLAALVLLTPACEEHNRLNRDLAEVRSELESVQKAIGDAESEQIRMTKEHNTLRNEPPLRWGSETGRRKMDAMKGETEGLRKKKTLLELTLPEFKADFESYRRKYLSS